LFKDCTGTGYIVILSRGGNPAVSDNWAIYGNIFHGNDRVSRKYDCTDGVIAVINGQIATNWKIYNNTFLNLKSPSGAGCPLAFRQSSNSSSGIYIYNNIWYNQSVSYTGDSRIAEYDYDYFVKSSSYPREPHMQTGSADPFTNYSGLDYSLKTSTNPGKSDLGNPYTIDPIGKVRGADGVWDRGAYEYVKGER
jgi:hypothetical protein